MRFSVNELIPVIAILYNVDPSTNLMFHAYKPWYPRISEISRIEFETLTVTEHHRVCNEWASDGAEPDCDGFILKSSKDEIWHNQYPRASYGQTSDACDRLFDRHLENGTFDAWFAANQNVPCQYRMLSDYLKDLMRGIHMRKAEEFKPESGYTEEDRQHTVLLERHLKTVCDQYEAERGQKITFTPHMIGEGENAKWLDGWYNVNFEQVTTDAPNTAVA